MAIFFVLLSHICVLFTLFELSVKKRKNKGEISNRAKREQEAHTSSVHTQSTFQVVLM